MANEKTIPDQETEVEPDSLVHHLTYLAADAEAIHDFLTQAHDEEGDIHPEALGRSERLATSLTEVIAALGKHEPLATKADDVWRVLTIGHEKRGSGSFN